MFWVVYASFVQMAFECNLRANLINVHYEEAINSDFELWSRGRSLYFPRNTAQWHFFINSPIRYQQKLGQLAVEKDAFFPCSEDNCPSVTDITQILNSGNKNFFFNLRNNFFILHRQWLGVQQGYPFG